MADTNNNQDPSMEDILASIRKIIDQDEKEEGSNAATNQATSETDEAEVLELTEVIDNDDTEDADAPLELTDVVIEGDDTDDVEAYAVASPDLAQAQAGGEDGVEGEVAPSAPAGSMQEMPQAEAVSASDTPIADHRPEPGHGEDVATAVPEHDEAEHQETNGMARDDGLISDQARSSAAAALGSLAKASDRGPLDGVPRGRPVEELVMDQLKPMLSAWLDEHLPTIVERIVEREVRYLSRRLENDDRD